VIDGVDGAITPVPVERAVERALVPAGQVTAGRVAAVGIGPAGCQQLAVVLETDSKAGLAATQLAAAVRNAVVAPVAAVLTIEEMPVDIRHNAKIDRALVAAWAEQVLAGDEPGASISGRVRRLIRR